MPCRDALQAAGPPHLPLDPLDDCFAAGYRHQAQSASLYQAGTPQNSPSNFTGSVWIATPQLLATYGIKASQAAPGTDILTMRPGLAGLPRMELTWGNYGLQQGPGGLVQKDSVLPSCTLSSDCLANPRMQTVSNLPAVAGWLLAGREPPLIARQPIE